MRKLLSGTLLFCKSSNAPTLSVTSLADAGCLSSEVACQPGSAEFPVIFLDARHVRLHVAAVTFHQVCRRLRQSRHRNVHSSLTIFSNWVQVFRAFSGRAQRTRTTLVDRCCFFFFGRYDDDDVSNPVGRVEFVLQFVFLFSSSLCASKREEWRMRAGEKGTIISEWIRECIRQHKKRGKN